ncbi:MAG: ketopantoate reductase family protein [Bacillota bacterium]|nr:ketopantoate reductase family protein [Bacillota bacterium]
MEIKKITIVGMGALGVMYGDFFTKKLGEGSLEFVANSSRIDRFTKEGVLCNGRSCDFTLVDEEEEGKPADLLLFAVKANSLESAIRSVKNKVSKDTIIMSLLNGISSEDIIGKAYGMEKIVHCVVQGMDVIKADNKVTYSQFGQFCIGITENTLDKKKRLQAVIDLFDKVGMPYTLEEDIKRRVWSKFMLNVGVNQAVMIYEGTYKTVQKPGKARELMQNAMKEVIILAEKENINITKEDFDYYVKLIDNMNPDGMPSMRQDGLAKRKSEVELFAGTVIALANKYKIDLPVNQWIYETVREMESKY